MLLRYCNLNLFIAIIHVGPKDGFENVEKVKSRKSGIGCRVMPLKIVLYLKSNHHIDDH